MNERIIELSKQAGDYVNETYTGPVRSKTPGKIWEDGHVDWHTQFNQKFAELIIKECVNIVSGTAVDTPPNDLFYGYNLGVNKAAENIKERFGIEELSPFNTVNS